MKLLLLFQFIIYSKLLSSSDSYILKRPEPFVALAHQHEPGKKILHSQFWLYKVFNFKPGESMAECHNKMARKKIAEKKAKANEKKLEELVDQLKGRIESTDTAEVEMIKSDL